jgi:WD40 repeat protein
MLASGSEDGTMRIWDLPNGSELSILQAQISGAYGVSLDASAHLLASAGAEGMVRLCDLRSGALLADLAGHTGVVHSVPLSSDGN